MSRSWRLVAGRSFLGSIYGRWVVGVGVGLVVAVAGLLRPSDCVAAPPASLVLESIDLADHRGRVWTVDDLLGRVNPDAVNVVAASAGDAGPVEARGRILVVAFLGTECPLAKLYAGRLSELADEFSAQGVRVVGVVSNRQDSLQKIGSFVDRQKIEYPVLKDPKNRFADALGAERTPEVFVFDGQRELRYWGRVDDRYGIGYSRDAAGREDLRSAIEDILAGREVAVSRTRSVGCLIGRTRDTDPEAETTYVNSVATILQDRCYSCHRAGEIAPFAMEDPHEVAGWADMIAEVVREGRMPPWHASPEHGEFANDRSMPENEKETLYRWAEAGAPLGDLQRDAHLLPERPTFTAGWQLPREPDLVVDVSPQPFKVPATGSVRYQYFKVDPGLDEDVWLESAELLPGNRAVVHHILAFNRPRGTEGGLDAARGFLVGYVPGARNEEWPKGMAKRIPGGSELIFQVHYTPIGTEQEDQSKLGLCFADPSTITHEVITTSALQTQFAIPPGADSHVVYGTAPKMTEDALLLGMSPHMHVRGKAFRYELQTADGERKVLLDIPGYDFNWQTTYVPVNPISLKKGDRMFCTAVYDNSEKNLNNPDPTSTVRWGDQTWDEMMIGYFHYAVPLPADEVQGAAGRGGRGRRDGNNSRGAGGGRAQAGAEQRAERQRMVNEAARLRKFEALDTDGDGRLSKSDVPAALYPIFDALDSNGDGVVTREEVVLGGNGS
jgi:peroxiredoxin